MFRWFSYLSFPNCILCTIYCHETMETHFTFLLWCYFGVVLEVSAVFGFSLVIVFLFCDSF